MVTEAMLRAYMSEDYPYMIASIEEMNAIEHYPVYRVYTIPLPQEGDDIKTMADFSIKVSADLSNLFLKHQVTKIAPLEIREIRRDRFGITFSVSTIVNRVPDAEWGNPNPPPNSLFNNEDENSKDDVDGVWF